MHKGNGYAMEQLLAWHAARELETRMDVPNIVDADHLKIMMFDVWHKASSLCPIKTNYVIRT